MTNGNDDAESSAAGAEDRDARRAWTQADEGIFTLIADDERCKVWRVDLGNTWGAMVSRGGIATASYNFTTRAEAQAWCEQQVQKGRER